MDDNHFRCINFVIWNKQTSRGWKKIGKMVGEYNKAKTEMQNQIKDMTKLNQIILQLMDQFKQRDKN